MKYMCYCAAAILAISCQAVCFGDEPTVEESYPGLQQTWIGVTRKGSPIKAAISPADLDYSTKKFRILIVGGLDGSDETTQFAIKANSYFHSLGRETDFHKRYSVSIVVDANPDSDGQSSSNQSGGDPSLGYPPKKGFYNSPTDPEAAYLWRWIGMHAPDLVVVAYRGEAQSWRFPKYENDGLTKLQALLKKSPKNLVTDSGPNSLEQGLATFAPADSGTIPSIGVTIGDETKFMSTLLANLDRAKFATPSSARLEIQKRLDRSPLEVATQLGKVYGHNLPQVVYIPTVALIGQLRLGELTNDKSRSANVRKIIAPYFSGEKPTSPKSGSHLSGHLIFTELAKSSEGQERERLIELAKNAADLAFAKDGNPKSSMPYHVEMSDAVFMGGPILASTGKLTGEKKYFDACARHVAFMQKMLLTPAGIYRHSPLDAAPWGRGNGFPSLGLALCLSDFPEDHPARKSLLDSFVAHLDALAEYQDATGCWHQVIDRPWSYRELTSTCMITFAIARGLRNHWLDEEKFRPIVDRAWYAIRTRVAANGELVDVCTGTGKQKNLRAYYDRTAILGKDGRGGAMALLAATEMALLAKRSTANK